MTPKWLIYYKTKQPTNFVFLETGINIIQAYLTIIQQHTDDLISYNLMHFVYFLQVELIINQDVGGLVINIAIVC